MIQNHEIFSPKVYESKKHEIKAIRKKISEATAVPIKNRLFSVIYKSLSCLKNFPKIVEKFKCLPN